WSVAVTAMEPSLVSFLRSCGWEVLGRPGSERRFSTRPRRSHPKLPLQLGPHRRNHGLIGALAVMVIHEEVGLAVDSRPGQASDTGGTRIEYRTTVRVVDRGSRENGRGREIFAPVPVEVVVSGHDRRSASAGAISHLRARPQP